MPPTLIVCRTLSSRESSARKSGGDVTAVSSFDTARSVPKVGGYSRGRTNSTRLVFLAQCDTPVAAVSVLLQLSARGQARTHTGGSRLCVSR